MTTQQKLTLAGLFVAGLLTTPAAFAHCGSCGAGETPHKKHSKGDETAKADYPLDTCVVSGAKLGKMGEPYVHTTEEGREVRFCCKGCLPTFKKSPGKFLEKIRAAEAKSGDGKAGSDDKGSAHPGHSH